MSKKLFRLLTISLVLTAIYFVWQVVLLANSFGVLSVVEEVPVNFKNTNQQDVHLLKDQKASGTFKASQDNFGILSIWLVKFGKGSDRIAFRIKKDREEKWHHESIFRGDQVQNNKYFPLGFPFFANSKNNKYVFEIESLAGEYRSGIGIIKEKPARLMYKYSAGNLKSFGTLLSFANSKFIYALKNINYWKVAAFFITSSLFVLFIIKTRVAAVKTVRFLSNFNASRFLSVFKKECIRVFKIIIRKIKSNYFSLEKKIVNFSNKSARKFYSTKFYLVLLNTNMKKRMAIGLLIFLLAFTYRFSASLVDQLNVSLFYESLGGGGDYDQFIRAATCAIRSFCPAILGQNFLFESSILGVFYEIFGFTGALKTFLYLMLILSSIVATLPYLLLSKKSWISIGGIIGSLYLATSSFLTHVALNFPPDNSSLFIFSIFYIVYFLTLQKGNIRWLLFFGLMGLVDGLNKALFLINDLAAFILFVPVFFYEKVREKGMPAFKAIFRKKNIKILFLSLLPLLVFLIIYSAWEYFVYVKWTAYYFLGELVHTRAGNYMSYTSLNDSALTGNIVLKLFYLCVSAIVMLKRLIAHTDLGVLFLVPIFLGLLFFSFIKPKFSMGKFLLTLAFSVFVIVLLALIKGNYFKIHDIFPGEYIFYNWKTEIYVGIYLFLTVIFLFILNFKYSVIKLALPIIPYVIILIILAKNSPFARLHTHVVAWSIILLAFLVDWILTNINNHSSKRIRIILPSLLLILFISFYGLPKMITMITQLNSGFAASQNEIRYLKWANSELPKNAVILAGGKSDLVAVGENIQRPIVYNALYSAAILIRQDEIPGVKSSDFGITGVSFLKGRIRIPSVGATDFSIVSELKNKDNFKRKRYLILEDDIYVWRSRLTGVGDNVFSTSSATLLHADDYSIKAYKFNPTLKKGIYELNTRDASVN